MNLKRQEMIDFLTDKNEFIFHKTTCFITINEDLSKKQWNELQEIDTLIYTDSEDVFIGIDGKSSHFFQIEYAQKIENSATKFYFQEIKKRLELITNISSFSIVPGITFDFYNESINLP
jgi:hypothetical protein